MEGRGGGGKYQRIRVCVRICMYAAVISIVCEKPMMSGSFFFRYNDYF